MHLPMLSVNTNYTRTPELTRHKVIGYWSEFCQIYMGSVSDKVKLGMKPISVQTQLDNLTLIITQKHIFMWVKIFPGISSSHLPYISFILPIQFFISHLLSLCLASHILLFYLLCFFVLSVQSPHLALSYACLFSSDHSYLSFHIPSLFILPVLSLSLLILNLLEKLFPSE